MPREHSLEGEKCDGCGNPYMVKSGFMRLRGTRNYKQRIQCQNCGHTQYPKGVKELAKKPD